MKPVLFLEYPPCSTCRKAAEWLEKKGIPFESRHIVLNRPSTEELTEWIRRSNKPLGKFFNTSGLKYKALGLKDKRQTMDTEEQIRLLASDGMLVKRPLIITEDTVLIGFKEAEWEERLKKA